MRFTANSFFLKNTPGLAYALLISSIGYARGHHANFSYWRTIWPWTQLVELSHQEIFSETLFPTFRPFIHLEKIAGETCGYFCIDGINKIVWSLCIFFITYSITECIRNNLIHKNQKYIDYSIIIILLCFPLYILFSGFGAFVDVTYPLGLILLFNSLYELITTKSKKNKSKPQGTKTSLILIAALLVEFSRPYGVIVLGLISLLFIYFAAYNYLLSILIAIIIASPYHFNQYNKTGSVFLTNFGGCYLAEINKPSEYVRPGKLGTQYLKKFPYQIKVAEICNKAKSDIINEYSKKPFNFIRNVLNPARIGKLILPPTFAPYQGIPNFLSFRGSVYWVTSFSTIIMFLFILLESSLTFSRLDLAFAPKYMMLVILLVPFLIDVLAHSGNEAIRHSLYFYLPLMFFAYKFQSIKPSDNKLNNKR